MKNSKELVPKDKFDFDSIQGLKNTSADDVEDILPELFEWLQDINWPVAQELSKILPDFGLVLLPYIRQVLRGADPQWQFSLLTSLIRELPKEISGELMDDIGRIALHPTEAEELEELDSLANETLDYIKSL